MNGSGSERTHFNAFSVKNLSKSQWKNSHANDYKRSTHAEKISEEYKSTHAVSSKMGGDDATSSKKSRLMNRVRAKKEQF